MSAPHGALAAPAPATADPRTVCWEAEQFLYLEADLLDEGRLVEWLDLLHPDLEYQVPLRRNVHSAHRADDHTRAGLDAMWFDEDKGTLTKRVAQLATGEHWAEEPVSRVSHLVTNVRAVRFGETDMDVSSRLLVHRNRVDVETSVLVGRRHDTLVRDGEGWLLRKRVVLLDQSVLLTKNLTFFL